MGGGGGVCFVVSESAREARAPEHESLHARI